MKDILIATTNEGKFNEIKSFCSDLAYNFLKLSDVGLENEVVDEPFNSTEENAVQKARFFAQKSNLPTVAEDTGFFVDYLNGEPGVHAKRYASTAKKRNSIVLEALQGVPKEKRGAHFETSTCFFDPSNNSFSVFKGLVKGLISEEIKNGAREGVGYDNIFYYEPLQKNFSDLTVAEKNSVSHRGQSLSKLKNFIIKQYGFKQIIVPVAAIIKDRKIFLNQRRDTYLPFNGKWEFPGGGIENGEEVESCLFREIKQETNLNIKIVQKIDKIYTESGNNLQVFLIVHICEYLGGEVITSPEESSNYGWFSLDEVLKMDLLPLNKKCIHENKDTFKKFVD